MSIELTQYRFHICIKQNILQYTSNLILYSSQSDNYTESKHILMV